MPITLTLTGDNGVDAAVQLLDFVSVIAGTRGQQLHSDFEPKCGPMTGGAVGNDISHMEGVKSEPVADTPKTEPAKEAEGTDDDSVEARRKARAEKKAGGKKTKESEATATEKTADAPATAPAAATTAANDSQPDFVPPADVTGELKESEAAPQESIDAAKKMYEQFKPKEGEPVTMNYCRALMLYVAAKKGLETSRQAMLALGVNRAQDLKPEQLADFAKKLEESLAK